MNWLTRLLDFLLGPIPQPVVTPNPVPMPPEPLAPILRFDTPHDAFHATRVMCDNAGLTFVQKDILCACVFQESRFLTNPKPNQNLKNGKVWSTDYGIIQINDYFHIGPGKDFPSVQYVLDNPDKCIQWMIGVMKKTGALQPWSSFSSGAYKQWLPLISPMWSLK